MLKIKVVAVTMIIINLLCSCSSRIGINEIEHLAFVSNIGIDQIPNEKGVLVSIRITDYASVSPSGQTDNETSTTFHVLSAQGESFYSAIKAIQVNSPQTLFFGHNKSIVFGKDFAESGIAEIIDGLERSTEITGSNRVFVSEILAKDALNMTFDHIKGSRSDYIEAMLESVNATTIIAPVMLYKFTLELKSDNKTSYAPVVSFIPSENNKENSQNNQGNSQNNSKNQAEINMEKTAIFKDNQLITMLPKKETTSFLWIRDEITEYTFIVPINNDDILTIGIKKGKTKIIPEKTEEGLIVKINCKAEAYLREVSYGTELIQNQEAITKIEKLIEDQLEQELQDSINYAKNQINCDYFGIAHVVHNKLPDYWKIPRENSGNHFPNFILFNGSDIH